MKKSGFLASILIIVCLNLSVKAKVKRYTIEAETAKLFNGITRVQEYPVIGENKVFHIFI